MGWRRLVSEIDHCGVGMTHGSGSEQAKSWTEVGTMETLVAVILGGAVVFADA